MVLKHEAYRILIKQFPSIWLLVQNIYCINEEIPAKFNKQANYGTVKINNKILTCFVKSRCHGYDDASYL